MYYQERVQELEANSDRSDSSVFHLPFSIFVDNRYWVSTNKFKHLKHSIKKFIKTVHNDEGTSNAAYELEHVDKKVGRLITTDVFFFLHATQDYDTVYEQINAWITS